MLPPVFTALTIALTVATVGFAFRCARSTGPGEAPADLDIRRHILWGAFYVNPDDPRGWVPKTSGLGTTPNFRTRANATIFAALLAATTASAAGLVVSALAL